MKKIFAIALALVMVLSMASAFALNNCSGNFSWTCPTDVNYCGKGSVEVIPYVKVNTACAPYFDYEVSTCAAAVAGENVYYAVKLTVDANADEAWWKVAKLTMSYTEITPVNGVAALKWNDLKKLIVDTDEANSFYFNFATQKWELVDDDFSFSSDNLDAAKVGKPTKAKVCAKLTSENNGLGKWTYGDYTVEVKADSITVTDGADFVVLAVADGKIKNVAVSKESFFSKVVADFNLGSCAIGTCVDADILKANFGWDDEVKSCFSWSSNAASVVDAECVVAIPKTGDVSVVAYAVMAVVAAAGTMLKK